MLSQSTQILNDDYPSVVEGYQLKQIIGEGHFGVVFKVEVQDGAHKGEQLALKKIELDKCTDYKLEELRRKMLLANNIHHKNLLSTKATFVTGSQLWVLQEFMDCGSLEMILKSHFQTGIKDMSLVATILKETLQGIAYLHQNNQIHRDIKAANILLSKNGNISISDFGLITKLKRNKKNHSIVGSPCWMAPEALDDTKQYDQKADIWSFGITIYEILYGKTPFSEYTAMKAIMTIINEEPPQIYKETWIDDSLIEMFNACLQKNKNDRLDANELLKNRFFLKAKGPEYIKEKLLKNITPLDERLKEYNHQFQSELEKLKLDKKQKSQQPAVQWDFSLSNDSGQGAKLKGQMNNRELAQSQDDEEQQMYKRISSKKLERVAGDEQLVSEEFFNGLHSEEQ